MVSPPPPACISALIALDPWDTFYESRTNSGIITHLLYFEKMD